MDDRHSKVPARTKIACDECRKNKRKVGAALQSAKRCSNLSKCDGKRPTCLLCEKSGRVCAYAFDAPRKRKYVDEDLIDNLQIQIAELQAQLEWYQENETGPGNIRGDSQLPIAKESSQHLPPSSKLFDNFSYQDGTSLQPPRVSPIDTRSHEAMEELASLMLTMDLEGQGEPSFTLPPGKSKAIVKRESSSIRIPLAHATDNLVISVETKQRLLGCFMRKFNIFHQFIEESPSRSIIQVQLSGDISDGQFRDYALLAVGAHLSENSDDLALSSTLAAIAEGMVLQCIRQRPSDLIIQGLALLAWRELMLGNDSMAYNYIGEFLIVTSLPILSRLITVSLSYGYWCNFASRTSCQRIQSFGSR